MIVTGEKTENNFEILFYNNIIKEFPVKGYVGNLKELESLQEKIFKFQFKEKMPIFFNEVLIKESKNERWDAIITKESKDKMIHVIIYRKYGEEKKLSFLDNKSVDLEEMIITMFQVLYPKTFLE